MSSSGLEEALTKARDTLASGALTNEAQVRSAVIAPLLNALGWDPADPSQWMVEHSVGTGRVDYALFGQNGSALVFVEAKKQGNLNPKAEDQLFGYANNKGVPLLVLTDGDTWDLYLSMAAGEPAERRFAHLTVSESSDLSDVARDLRAFVARSEVWSGAADDTAKERLKQVKDREIGKGGLESAWAELLREPDDILRDLLIERVEQEVGARPTTDDAERFLRRQLRGPESPQPPPGDPDVQPLPSRNLRGFRIQGQSHEAKSGRETMTLLASALEQHNAGFLEAWGKSGRPGAARRRSVRSHDSRLQDEGLKTGYRSVEEFPDWYLWVHGSTATRLKLMQRMTELAGLKWGSDVAPLLEV